MRDPRSTAESPSTERSRSAERHKRLTQSAIASACAKALVVATTLISVPLTLNYLGPERYGMWMTMSSLVAMLAFADMGIGNGVLSLVAKAHGNDDRAKIRACVSSAYAALSFIAAALLCALAAVYGIVPWPSLFNVLSDQARQEAGPAFATFAVVFCLAIPLSIVQRVQMGLQRGFLASLWQCLGSILGLLGVLLAIRLEAGLPWLVLAFVGTPLIASLLNSLIFFGRLDADIAPSTRSISRDTMREVLHAGGLYFVLQVVGAIAYLSDTIVIAQILGAAAVAPFAVVERMFSFITVILMMFLAPLWPAYTEALARGDAAWVRKTLRRSLVLAVGAALAMSLLLLGFGNWLILKWVGPSVQAAAVLLASFAAWKVLESAGMALAMFLNGAHVVGAQIRIGIITGIVALTAKIVLVQQVGVHGALWATFAAFLVFSMIPILRMLPGLLPKTPTLAGSA